MLLTKAEREDWRHLFTLRVDLSGARRLYIAAREGDFQEPNHTRIDVKAILAWKDAGGNLVQQTIFDWGDTYCGLAGGHTLDGDDARELVMSLIAMKPGDTDPDYFASYTPAQLAFAETYGEEIALEALGRYGER